MTDRIAVYCTDELTSVFRDGIDRFADEHSRPIEASYTTDYREFLDSLSHDSCWKMLIIAMTGARGMETVYHVRELFPDVPLLWCSDDTDFAVASYRMRCSLFLTLPDTAKDVTDALGRCLDPFQIDHNKSHVS